MTTTQAKCAAKARGRRPGANGAERRRGARALALRLATLLPLGAGAMLWIACGQPPPVEAPKPAASTEPGPAPSAEPAPAASAEPGPAPSAEPDKPPKKTGGGRPPILKMDPAEITDTFGSTPAAKLEIGDKEPAVLRIPEGALSKATNVTFKLDSKGKNGGGLVGKVYRITFIVPPAGDPIAITSESEPFELRLPAGNKKDANLAVGEITTDDKGREKVVWTISAPKKIDDVSSTAFYEVATLRDAWLHVTTKPPAGPPPEKK